MGIFPVYPPGGGGGGGGVYRENPCIHPGGFTGKIPASKATKSHMTRLHTVNSIDCGRNFGREWLALPEVERARATPSGLLTQYLVYMVYTPGGHGITTTYTVCYSLLLVCVQVRGVSESTHCQLSTSSCVCWIECTSHHRSTSNDG